MKWLYWAFGVLQDEMALRGAWCPTGRMALRGAWCPTGRMALQGAWCPTGRMDFYLKPCDVGYIRVCWKFFSMNPDDFERIFVGAECVENFFYEPG